MISHNFVNHVCVVCGRSEEGFPPTLMECITYRAPQDKGCYTDKQIEDMNLYCRTIEELHKKKK